MGAVWVADHKTLRTEVVVKFISEELATDPVSLARFSREASAAAAVKSPHVVQMLDHGLMADGTPFIVMELLDGEDLRHRLERKGTIDLPLLGTILSQTCKALGRAHTAGIIHRDIKPDNIFLCHSDDGDTFVKLLDFGIARSGTPTDFHVTKTGAIMGTPFYMSPEQAIGEPIDARSDLWSLGVVAFEAMTGTRPFQGATLGALTIAICSETPPVPSRINPKLKPAVDAWLARACARTHDQRFATAREMSDAFAAAILTTPSPHIGPLAFQATLPSRTPVPPAPPAPPASPKPVAEPLATTAAPLARTQNDAPPSRSRRSLGVVGGMLVLGGALVAIAATLRPPATSSGAPPTAAAHEPLASSGPAPHASQGWVEITPPVAVPPPSLPSHEPALAPQPRVVPPPGPPASGAKPRRTAPEPRSPAATGAGCDPPYFYDALRNKVFKPERLE